MTKDRSTVHRRRKCRRRLAAEAPGFSDYLNDSSRDFFARVRAEQIFDNDRGDNDSFDPVLHSRYRSADRGYESRYGTKEQYKLAYRDGFEAGYEQGYGRVVRR